MGRRLLPLLSLLLVPASAHAIRASEKAPPEFGRLDRARVADPVRQAALTASPEWSRFTATFGNQWTVTWDDRAGTPRSILGATIPLVAQNAGATEVESAARAFLDSIGYLTGVSDSQLRTSVLTKVRDTWYVRFARVTASGAEISGAFAELRLVKGNIVHIKIETHPGVERVLPAAKLTKAEAITKAHKALEGFVSTQSLASSATSKIVPIAVGKEWTYRPAFEVMSVGGPTLRLRSVVDAVYGEVLARENTVRFAVDGQFSGMVEPRTIGDTTVATPFPYVIANVGGANVTADIIGNYNAPAASAPASISITLTGTYVNVNNENGADLSNTFTASSATGNQHVWTGSGVRELAQLDSFVSANDAKKWARTVTPGAGWLNGSMNVNVNIGQQCNAYFDGNSINFFDEGSECHNTARIADVVYHEFGHYFHQETAVSGTIDGAVGEGTGDFVSATITGSPDIGPYFLKNGDPVREIEGNRVYPDDLVGQVHEDGLIWGGSMWDLRKALIAKHGAALGKETTDLIFARALEAGPTLDQTYDAVLLADDDDGDLSNGTPNQCEIDAAFGAHGLASGSSAFGLAHTEITGPVNPGSITVTASKPSSSGLCAAGGITSATLRYKIDGGATQSVSLSASGDDFTGEIPGASAGSVVRYWFEGQLEGGTTVTTPPRAPENVYAFYVGPLFTVWKDDFEGDLLWTDGGSGSDWEIGTPNGSSNDPAGAYSGTQAFGNSVGDDGAYMANANNWAESVEIDCTGCRDARLQLRRWLTVEDASYDFARILVNGEQVYQNPVGAGNGGALPRDPMWSFQDYDISDIADGEKITIRFELESDQGVEYGGWTVDDVTIVTPGALTAGGDGGHGLFGCGCTMDARASSAMAGPLALFALAALPFLRRRGYSHPTGA